MTIDSLMLGYILELKQHKKENLKLNYVKENPTIMSEYVAMTQQYQAPKESGIFIGSVEHNLGNPFKFHQFTQ